MIRTAATRFRGALGNLLPLVAVWCSTLAAVVLVGTGQAVAGAAVSVVAVALAWPQGARPGGDQHLAARAALAAVLGFGVGRAGDWPSVVAVVLLLAAVMLDPQVRWLERPLVSAHRLPHLRRPLVSRVRAPLFQAGCLGLVVLAGSTLVPAAAFAVPVVLAAGLTLTAVQVVRVRRGAPQQEVRRALLDYEPKFYIYYSGTPLGDYQVRMWLPYLERIGVRFAILTREVGFIPKALAAGPMPVLFARSMAGLEPLMVPSLGAIFYVNNEAKNANGVRFAGIRHVHLGHGDSEKPASYNASTLQFDFVFVAGQAGFDRFAAHGVPAPKDKFVLVGRPQLDELRVRENSSAIEHPVVLYAPTWRGGLADMQLGSLEYGYRIVRALLEAGSTVLFRPHPYSRGDGESRVQIQRIDALLDPSAGHMGSTATSALSIFECMNRSDALVCDVSSIASDYLYSRKPFAIVDTGVVPDLVSSLPVAAAAYILPVDGDLQGPVADLLGTDSLAVEREKIRAYYLGEWPADRYSKAFVDAARAAVTGEPATIGLHPR